MGHQEKAREGKSFLNIGNRKRNGFSVRNARKALTVFARDFKNQFGKQGMRPVSREKTENRKKARLTHPDRIARHQAGFLLRTNHRSEKPGKHRRKAVLTASSVIPDLKWSEYAPCAWFPRSEERTVCGSGIL